MFSKDFAINHDKELDKTTIYCKIKNMSNEEALESRSSLYFNKEMLPLGQVLIRVSDHIRLSFHVQNFVDVETENEAFAEFIFEVEQNGFRKIAGQCRDNYIGDVKTWKTVMTYLDLNYIEDGTLGQTSLAFNQTEMKKQQL